MLCNHCGFPLPEKASFCPKCGKAPAGADPESRKESTPLPKQGGPFDDRPFATPTFEAEGKGDKGDKGRVPKWLFFVAPIGLILILGLLLFPLFRGDLIKAFKTTGNILPTLRNGRWRKRAKTSPLSTRP
ncbi:MAG: zinc ribbon domain-containing protein [Clostridia bacterium]|nr:zinc ribbon domain-containing protein [Clostridia bacterium]